MEVKPLKAQLTYQTYSWRILWLLGLPTGVLFILLNRWIPESPRFLLASAREADAYAVMRRFGAVASDVVGDEHAPATFAVESKVPSRVMACTTLCTGSKILPTTSVFGPQVW